MNKKTYRLVKQRGSDFWYVDYQIWNAAHGALRRKFTSTKTDNKRLAERIAESMVAIAQEVTKNAVKGWSRESVMAFVHELERAAGMPETKLVASWQSFAAEWLASRATKVAGASAHIYSRRVGDLSEWLKKDRDLNDITGLELQSFYDGLISGGKRPQTANSTLSTIREIFERAKQEGLCSRNPAALVETRTDARLAVIKEPFTVEEVRRLLVAARSWSKTGAEWETAILIGICLGARLHDCVNLGLSHLDRSGPLWTLHYTPRKTERRGTRIEVPVVEPLRSRLASIVKRGEALLFCPTLAQQANLSLTFARIMSVAGIQQQVSVNPITARENKSKTFHSLRHTLPSWLKSAGVDEETRMKIIGHASKSVHQRYTHAEMKDLAAALNAGLGRLVG